MQYIKIKYIYKQQYAKRVYNLCNVIEFYIFCLIFINAKANDNFRMENNCFKNFSDTLIVEDS